MQQFAAFETLLAGQGEWAGKVVGVMINQDVAVSGLESCASTASLPLLQDNGEGQLWKVLGAAYNSYIVVDESGILVAIFIGKALPEIETDLIAAVNQALD